MDQTPKTEKHTPKTCPPVNCTLLTRPEGPALCQPRATPWERVTFKLQAPTGRPQTVHRPNTPPAKTHLTPKTTHLYPVNCTLLSRPKGPSLCQPSPTGWERNTREMPSPQRGSSIAALSASSNRSRCPRPMLRWRCLSGTSLQSIH